MLNQEELEQLIRMYLQQGGYSSMSMPSMSGEDNGYRPPGYEQMMQTGQLPQKQYQTSGSNYAPENYSAARRTNQYTGSSYGGSKGQSSYQGPRSAAPMSYAKGSGGATYATR